jgi:hypothetical protein
MLRKAHIISTASDAERTCVMPRLPLTDADIQVYEHAARYERAQMIGELIATAIAGVIDLFRHKPDAPAHDAGWAMAKAPRGR